ncbi:MAG TPA: cytochrome-c peroxidase, partial [Blastocatellia bacterium]|nr:cytochrome-c peroxidase [Blastocatellia bacterium]
MTASASRAPLAEPRTSRRPRRLWLKFLLTLVVLLVAGFIALGAWPAPKDFSGEEGLTGVNPNGGGLLRPFPAMVMRGDNDTNNAKFKERAELGRLLFFDPILSGDNAVSCATCHHPDLGFGDGRGLAMGKGAHGLGPERAGGADVRRGAPTIWNSTYNHLQFWDGRARDLEEQAEGPIKSDVEM